MNKNNFSWNITDSDLNSLYPNILDIYNVADLTKDLNQMRLKKQRIEKLKKINNL